MFSWVDLFAVVTFACADNTNFLEKVHMGTLLAKTSHYDQLQWNLDLTKCKGTGEICLSYRGFIISKTSIKRICGKTTKMFVISRYS